MGDKSNGNGVKITLWLFAVIIFPTLFFIGRETIAANKDRIKDDKQICMEMKKEDSLLRADFLIALRDMRLEQKADMGKLSDKIDDIKDDVSKIKGGMEKKTR